MNRHFARGQRLIELKRHVEAAQEFIQAAAHADNPAHCLALAANSRLTEGDLDGAHDLLEQARRLDPNDSVVLLTGVHFCMTAGDAVGARSLAAQALRQQPTCPETLGSAAWMEIILDNPEAACRYAQAGLEIDPVHEACLEAMITALGSAPEADTYTRRLLAAAPENVEAHRALARVGVGDDQLAEASAHAREAVRLDPTSPESLERLAATGAHGHPLFRAMAEGRIGRRHISTWLGILALFIPTILWFPTTLALSVYLGEDKLADLKSWTSWIERALRPQSLAIAWVSFLLGWQGVYTLLCATFLPAFRPLLRAARGNLLLAPGLSTASSGALLAYIITGDWGFYGAAFIVIVSQTLMGMILGARSFPMTTCVLATSSITVVAMITAVLGFFYDFPSGIVLWGLVALTVTAFFALKPGHETAPTSSPLPPP